MNSDREKLYQARMALAIKLSEDTVYAPIIALNVDMYNRADSDWKKKKFYGGINALMKAIVGSHWSCFECGINQYGFWSREEE
tara:strand:- start:1477 stop:1725 length:249 start_codon:yes stop_codon:yes gene_type:complete